MTTTRLSRGLRTSLLVALLAALHSLLWTGLMPPGTGGDEEGHFAVVEHLALKRTLPIPLVNYHITREFKSVLDEMKHGELILDPLQKPRFAPRPSALPREGFESDHHFFGSAGGPPVHYLTLLPVYHLFRRSPVLVRFYAVRAFGLLFAALTAFLAHRTLRRLEVDETVAACVSILVACQPMAHFIFGCVTNDGGTLAIFAVLLHILVGDARRGISARGALARGCLCGLAALVKPFAISLAIPFFFMCLSRSSNRKQAAWNAAFFLLGSCLTLMPWGVWSFVQYGGPTSYSRNAATERLGLGEIVLKYLEIASPGALFSQTFGVFGRLCTPLPKGVRAAAAAVFLFGWAIFLSRALLGRERREWLWLAAVPVIHSVVVVVVAYWTLYSTGYRLGLQGRYFIYPLLALIAPMAKGWFACFPRPQAPARFASFLALLLAVYSLGWIVMRRYYL